MKKSIVNEDIASIKLNNHQSYKHITIVLVVLVVLVLLVVLVVHLPKQTKNDV